MKKEVFVASNITKYFGKKCVLDNVSFSIYEGDLIGLVGINGAGKTTLFKCMTGLLQCEGEVIAYGNSFRDREKYLQDIVYIFDRETLFAEMTGYQVILDFSTFYGKYKKEEIYEVLKNVGLQGSENIKVKKYSLGMKQRLNIAKIILAKPKIVFMDEPFNGIDIDGVEYLISLINKMNKELGTIFVVSSHQVNELEKFATRILGLVESKLTIDRYIEDREQILIAVKLSNNNDISLLKDNFNYKYSKNDILYFESNSDEVEKFVSFLNDNNITYTYFDTNNAVKQEIYDVLGGQENV